MILPNLMPLLSYVFITTFTPGPNNIMSMLNAGKHGFKKGLKFNFGIFLGFSLVMVVCGAFSAALLQYLPAIKPVMIYFGGGYILWLAYKTYKSVYTLREDAVEVIYGIKEGFLLQFINPKVIIYGITSLSTFIVPYYERSLTILGFSIAFAFVAFIATCCWAIFGAAFHRILTTRAKTINTVMAIILVLTAVSLFR